MLIDKQIVQVEIAGTKMVLEFVVRSEDAKPESNVAYPSYLDRYDDPDFFVPKPKGKTRV